jgi:hypothetical protein
MNPFSLTAVSAPSSAVMSWFGTGRRYEFARSAPGGRSRPRVQGEVKAMATAGDRNRANAAFF